MDQAGGSQIPNGSLLGLLQLGVTCLAACVTHWLNMAHQYIECVWQGMCVVVLRSTSASWGVCNELLGPLAAPCQAQGPSLSFPAPFPPPPAAIHSHSICQAGWQLHVLHPSIHRLQPLTVPATHRRRVGACNSHQTALFGPSTSHSNGGTSSGGEWGVWCAGWWWHMLQVWIQASPRPVHHDASHRHSHGHNM
jgi:hypothetical protein